ncbi:hypothetical protein FXI36_24400 [Escherichia coli]|nr:hypothetical protein [Escherichia coli]
MAGRISSLNASEKKFIDDALAESERVKGKSLNGIERKSVLSRAREQILSQRKAESAKKEREAERHANEFTWNKPKPLRR